MNYIDTFYELFHFKLQLVLYQSIIVPRYAWNSNFTVDFHSHKNFLILIYYYKYNNISHC